MLKSLYSGVSGLQSHQIAMDVESNNIANVNTTGFKYSRANFSNLLAQTRSIATAPQGELGGKNAVQVGLGSTVSSMTTIFSQGSIQNSDKNTDVAIQGDGFFIVSPNGGNSYKYTRAGDFKFDANGNFVDNNGFIVQGWVRDQTTGKVDSTAPIENINIPPGLTTPASPTSEITLKANLNAGTLVESYSPAYPVGSTPSPSFGHTAPSALDKNGNPIESGDLGVMFNDTGEGFSLQEGQGVWASFRNSSVTSANNILATAADSSESITFTLDDGTTEVINFNFLAGNTAAQNAAIEVSAINSKTATTGIIASLNGTQLVIENSNANSSASHNIRVAAVSSANVGLVDTEDSTTAYTYTYNSTGPTTVEGSSKEFRTMSDLREAMEKQARAESATVSDIITTTVAATATATHTIDIDGTSVSITNNNGDDAATVASNYASAINTAMGAGWATAVGSKLTIANPSGADISIDTTTANGNDAGLSGLPADLVTPSASYFENNIKVLISDQGKFEISNPGGSIGNDYDVNLAITGFSAIGTNENPRFTKNMEALNSVIGSGSTGRAFSQSFNAATHSSSIDIFDSLGSKHTIRMEFRKTAVNASTGSTWDMTITVPTPSTIDNVAPFGEKKGSIRFNSDGSLSTFNPPNVSFTGNNGSSPEQQVNLNFGTSNLFDGMTSFDSRSSTSGISQDGFTGGDLVGIRIDQSGTIVGSFSNGRSFGLAQVGMAKFTNNEGLATEGGSVYVQTANSGDPIIGAAATSGRGFIQSSALEASNVDLSRSLTQLIIIQRGYQANGKTITTSDQLLQTLIGLKN